MSRYMWICKRGTAPSSVLSRIEARLEPAVTRFFYTQKRACWVFITTRQTYEWAKAEGLTDTSVGPWSITACNKQYVADEGSPVGMVYLGCLANVSSNEAYDWINADKTNWYLCDPGSDSYWIPVMRNPNKRIPTGDASARLWPKQVRNWPLQSASYEEWRDGIVNKMIKVLDEAL